MWCAAALCAAAAVYFWFGIIGYEFTAMFFAGIMCVLLLFIGFRRLERRREKLGRRLRRVLSICLAIGAVSTALLEIPIVRGSKTDPEPEAPYLIVLGAGLNGTEPSLALKWRLEAALDYLNEYPDTIAIVSGGQGRGEDITEAEAMKNWLVKNGIDSDRVWKEDKSTSTWENLTFSMDVIRENRDYSEDGSGGEIRAAIVTNEFHLYRAKTMAKKWE